ncbi:MAG: DUF4349 domain-containing protein [Oscillospiraceae bacterium]|nr:DUF4349 domain-containing protein [Oscillospiraceae bacterium]
MRKKILTLAALVLTFALLLAACGQEMYRSLGEADGNYYAWAGELDGAVVLQSARVRASNGEDSPADADDSDDTPSASNAGRMLIRDVTARVETREFDQYMTDIETLIAALGGHVQQLETTSFGYTGRREARQATLVARVPSARLREFTGQMGENGRVTRFNESVRDVTVQYTDTQAQLEALRAEQTTLLRMLENTNALADVLALQDRLTSLRHQINTLESLARTMQEQVTLSTVNMTIQEVAEFSQLQEDDDEDERGFARRTWDGFVNSLFALGRGLRAVGAALFIALPFIVFFGAIAAAALFVRHKIMLKRKQQSTTDQPE